jgi:hypothetical protein
MSRNRWNSSDRSPMNSKHDLGGGSRASRLLRTAAILAMLAFATSAALAQEDPPPRIDPGDGPAISPGVADSWSVLTIPGLPQGAVLGDVWATADGQIYVWAAYPTRLVSRLPMADEPGEKLPNTPPPHSTWSSTLYRYSVGAWAPVLQTNGEKGIALYGTDASHLYASTADPQGAAKLYRFDGTQWSLETLPGQYYGTLHTMAGKPGDLFFRVDNLVLRDDGTKFSPFFSLPAGESATRGLVSLGTNGLYVMCPDGHWFYSLGEWTPCSDAISFPNVQDAWGMVDGLGRLEMFALGSDGAAMRIWRYNETNPLMHEGDWSVCMADAAGPGEGFHLWGDYINNLYATAIVGDQVHLLRFDGVAWKHLTPPADLHAVHGVWGTSQGTVWFTTDQGRVLRFQRGNSPPDLSVARASIERLWPDDRRMVGITVNGIVDAEGDPFTVQITGVTQDENPKTPGVAGNCPDAILNGSAVLLRAEHADGGDGRTYHVQFTATDRLGMTSAGEVVVCAPHFVDTPCDVDPGIYNSLGPCTRPGGDGTSLDAEAQGGTWQIRYELATSDHVHLAVYDLAGRQRMTLEDGLRSAGTHEVAWNAGGLAPGVYFVKLRSTGGTALARRVVVFR